MLFFGFLGIFLPVLPTTPLILAAAFCFAKGSDRFYNWLIEHRLFGKYVKDYSSGEGIPVRAKVKAITLLWVTISVSVFLVDIFILRIFLAIIAAGVTIYLLYLPSKRFNGS